MKDLPVFTDLTASDQKEVSGGFFKRISITTTLENGNSFQSVLTISPEGSNVQEREICENCPVDENGNPDETSAPFNTLVQKCKASEGGLSSCKGSDGQATICCDF